MREQSAERRGASARRRPADDYEVGYGKPPKHGQFKKGQSRKRKLRRQDDDNLMSVFKRYVAEKVRIREGGQERIMTRGEAVLYANYHRALKDPRAMHNVFVLAEEHGLFTDLTNIEQVGAPIAAPEPAKSVEEWEKTTRLYEIMLQEDRELTGLEDRLEPGQHPFFRNR